MLAGRVSPREACAMPGAGNNPLLAAFLGLLPTTSVERQEAILRRALQQVLADPDDQPSRPLVARSPTISTVDSEDWLSLKPRLRAELELRGMSLVDLAKDADIPLATVQKVLSPKGLVPGRLIADRMQAWLDSRAAQTGADQAVDQTAMSVAQDKTPAPSRTVGNGHAPASGIGARPLAGRLTESERERLAGFASFTEERELRRALGLTSSVIDQAIAGAELPAEAIERIANFLAAQGDGIG